MSPVHSGRNEAMLQPGQGIAVGGSAEPPSGKWLGLSVPASLVRG